MLTTASPHHPTQPSRLRPVCGQKASTAHWPVSALIGPLTVAEPRGELNEAIPPAYTAFIGHHLRAHLNAARTGEATPSTEGTESFAC